MKTVQVSSLIGPTLDWAVAKSNGLDVYHIWEDEIQVITNRHWITYHPSTNWNQGGPIIESEDITFRKYHNPGKERHGIYYARICRESGTMVGWYKTTGFQQTGPTPLIAAMRCYVASKLGTTIEIPEELYEEK